MGSCNKGRETSRGLWCSVLFLGTTGLGAILHGLFAQSVVKAAFEGRSLWFLNRLIEWHRSTKPFETSLEYYLIKGEILLGPYVLICFGAYLATMALIYRDKTRRWLRGMPRS